MTRGYVPVDVDTFFETNVRLGRFQAATESAAKTMRRLAARLRQPCSKVARDVIADLIDSEAKFLETALTKGESA